jgi:hypothetical protein
VEFWLGDSATANPVHMGLGYSVRVSGDFSTSGSISTQYHWWGARWRVTGNATNKLRLGFGRNDWPYVPTAYSQLVSDKLIPQWDASVYPNGPATPSSGSAVGYFGFTGLSTGFIPMMPGPIQSYMPDTGPRGDIGLFNGWGSAYAITQAPSASPACRAMASTWIRWMQCYAEYSTSIPWYVYNPTAGCMAEPVVNNIRGGMPGPVPYSITSIRATGTPGATIDQYFIAVGAPSNQQKWNTNQYPGLKIPAGGTITFPIYSDTWSMYLAPTGTPQPAGNGKPGITYAWDNSKYVPATFWNINPPHEPECAYLAYLFFRDPYDLMTVQASALHSAYLWGPTFGLNEVRQVAWDYTHAIQAYAATPSGAPSWIVPKSTHQTWLGRVQTWIINNCVNSRSPLSTVFHSINAASGPQNYGGPDGKSIGDARCSAWYGHIIPWQEDMVGAASALCVILAPSTSATTIAKWSLQQVDDRRNGTSGMPRALRTPYALAVCGSDRIIYPSLNAAYEGLNKEEFFSRNNCTPPPDPGPSKASDLVTAYGVRATEEQLDYLIYDLQALTLATQAGLTEFKASRDFIRSAFSLSSNWWTQIDNGRSWYAPP